MKRLLILVVIVSSYPFQILALSIPALTDHIIQDTLIQNDTLRITPYFGKVLTKGLGNYAVVTPGKIAFQTYAGFNVLNTLRGYAPSFSMGPNTSPTSPGLRSGESMMVIDGLPLNSGIANYYNLNSFEYQNVYALSSGNALTLYGGQGSNGAFFLQSKTGENFTKPTFEFNSSATQLWSETSSSLLSSKPKKYNQTIFTNALAYKQDFGAIDTRVSYTYNFLPDGSTDADTKSGYHSLRINTGVLITPRLKARLVLDDFYNKSVSSQKIVYQGQSILSESESKQKNLQGNFQLQYQILDWLTISSQSSIAKIENDDVSAWQAILKTDRSQKQYFANIFASVNKSIGQNWILTSFAGYQYEKSKKESYAVQTFNNQPPSKRGQTSENKILSFTAGAGFQFKNYLFSTLNYRMDYVSNYASDNNDVPSYSLNTSFIFSEAFHWKNSWFSFGKMRVSTGKTGVALKLGYPDEWTTVPVNTYPNPDLHASTKKMFEAGFDLGFVQNRITLNASYFLDHHDEMASQIPVPSGSNGVSYVLLNLWTLDTKGWELVMGVTPIKRSDFRMDTKLIWSTYNTRLDNSSDLYTGNNSIPVIRGGVIIINQTSGNPNQGVSLGNPYPDWTGSLLNQITFKNFFTSFLIDVREGGIFYSMDYSSNFPTYSTQDGSIAKLRDLSIGYRLSSSALDKLNIREAQLSVSGRNMWTIYSKSDSEAEGSLSSTPQKSASLSLTLMF